MKLKNLYLSPVAFSRHSIINHKRAISRFNRVYVYVTALKDFH